MQRPRRRGLLVFGWPSLVRCVIHLHPSLIVDLGDRTISSGTVGAPNPYRRSVALPYKGGHQPGVLEADLEMVPDCQLGEHPIGLFHRKPGLKRRPRRRYLPVAPDHLKQHFLPCRLSG